MSAVRSPCPARTWWSTQLYARLERPPRYQRNVGGSHSSTRSHFLNHGSASAASPQNLSGSAVAARPPAPPLRSSPALSPPPVSPPFTSCISPPPASAAPCRRRPP